MGFLSLHFTDTKVSHLPCHPNSLYSQWKEKGASPKQFVPSPPPPPPFCLLGVPFHFYHFLLSGQILLYPYDNQLAMGLANTEPDGCQGFLWDITASLLPLPSSLVLGVHYPFWGAFILFCCNMHNLSRSALKKVTVLVLGRDGVTKSYLAFWSPGEMLY